MFYADDITFDYLQALKELDSAQQSGNKQHASDFMQSVLLRRLADDEPQVLDAALSLPSLRLMPRSVLYDAVAGIMLKYSGAVANLGSSQRKAWRLVAQKVGSSYVSAPLAMLVGMVMQ